MLNSLFMGLFQLFRKMPQVQPSQARVSLALQPGKVKQGALLVQVILNMINRGG
jgi:hypothetical protein